MEMLSRKTRDVEFAVLTYKVYRSIPWVLNSKL